MSGSPRPTPEHADRHVAPPAGRRDVHDVLDDAAVPSTGAALLTLVTMALAVGASIALVVVAFLGLDVFGVAGFEGSVPAGLVAIFVGQPLVWLAWLAVARRASHR